MTTSTQVDLVEFKTNTVGIGSALAIGAATNGHRGSEALIDGATYSYSIGQRDSYEIGRGIYSESNQSITRGVLLSSDSNQPIAILNGAVVSIVLLAEDLDGLVGGSPNFIIGNVTSGSPAAVNIRGVSPNFILDFVLVTGSVGATGPAPNLTIGATTVVASDQPPLVQMTGTNPDYQLHFTLPAVQPNGLFNTPVLMRSDAPVASRLSINGIASQYYRIFNYCVDDTPTGSGSFGQGILQVKWSNDTKAIVDIIAKSRAATIGGAPVSVQAGDQIYSQAWYGDCGPTVGAPLGSMGHIGQFKVAVDGAPTGDSTELPGYVAWYTGTGFHIPGSRIALEINSRQQIHAPGPVSSAYGPTGASYGANFVLGVGAAAAGSAPLKLILAGTALLTTAEAGALEPDAAGILYFTNAAAKRRQLVDADTAAPTITPGSGAGTAPTIAIAFGPNCGRITLTTGTGPATGGVIATVTYGNAFPADSFVSITPANGPAATAEKSFFALGSAGGFVITNVTAALAAGTQYIWEFTYGGK